jgi:hypothetical protein
VHGDGTIAASGGQASFRLDAQRQKQKNKFKLKGSFSYSDPAAGISFSNGKLSSLTITGNHATVRGTAKLGRRNNVSFTVDVTDNGTPGILDTFSVSLSNGYSAGGNLTSGNITIH